MTALAQLLELDLERWHLGGGTSCLGRNVHHWHVQVFDGPASVESMRAPSPASGPVHVMWIRHDCESPSLIRDFESVADAAAAIRHHVTRGPECVCGSDSPPVASDGQGRGDGYEMCPECGMI